MPARTRKCVDCQRRLPATEKYFSKRRTSDELREACKTCWTQRLKVSGWYSTPKSLRKRKGIEITLSDAARAKLEAMVQAKGGGNIRSSIIEELIMKAKTP